MTLSDFTISTLASSETHDNLAIGRLLDDAFGLDRRAKSSYRLRENEKAVEGLSFVAKNKTDEIIGTISFWDIHLGEQGTKALLLGPLAVEPAQQSTGIGIALMNHGIATAKNLGHKLVILVGDAPYYAKVGFKQVPINSLLMPGANDPQRLLYLELESGAFGDQNGSTPTGLIRSPSRWANKA